MHLAWLKEGHLRGRMDDMSTTKFRLFTLLSDYFLRLCSLIYCTSVTRATFISPSAVSSQNRKQPPDVALFLLSTEIKYKSN